MATEMTRIETPSDAEREVINLLTPDERRLALVEAGKAKQRNLDKRLIQEHLSRIRSGELKPVVSDESWGNKEMVYEGYGKTMYVKDSHKPYKNLGRVPGHIGLHVLQDDKGKFEFWGGMYVSDDPDEWAKFWAKLGTSEDD